MATLSFSFDTGAEPISRFVNGICLNRGYLPVIPDPNNSNVTIPNPESKAQFARRQIKEIILNDLKNVEGEAAAKTAKDVAVAAIPTLT